MLVLQRSCKYQAEAKLAFIVLLAGAFFIQMTNARCEIQNRTDAFGLLHYIQRTGQFTPESCSWTFHPPKNFESSVLVFRLISFATIPETNYLLLPGGNAVVNNTSKRSYLNRCTKFLLSSGSNLCSKKYLENYCEGATYEVSQWPPVLESHSSKRNGQDSSTHYYFVFTVLYMFLPCPNEQNIQHPATTNPIPTMFATNKTNKSEQNFKDFGGDKVFPEMTKKLSSERGGDNSLLAAITAIASVSFLLVVGFCVIIAYLIVKLLKLRHAKLTEYSYVNHRDSESTYCYATDVNVGVDSSGAYAAVDYGKKQPEETCPRNAYLTMRNNTSLKNFQYEEIKAAAQRNNLYATLSPRERSEGLKEQSVEEVSTSSTEN